MDLSAPTALDYVPTKIGRKPLYQFLGPLIDHALEPSDGVDAAEIDPLVRSLLLDYQDAEAVNAYVNLLIRPIIGTRRAMDYVFGLLAISPALVEWWQPELRSPYDHADPVGQSDRPYRFTVTFPDGSLPRGQFSYGDLIHMLLALKNERSRLVSVRMADCVGMLTLDEDCETDMFWLGDLEGFVDPDTGVNICLHDHFVQQSDNSERVGASIATSIRGEVTQAFRAGLLDYTILGEDTDLDGGSIQTDTARVSQRAVHDVYAPRLVDPSTGEFTQPYGRTSNVVSLAGGRSVEPHSQTARTTDRQHGVILNLAPRTAQTIPGRLTTQQVPSWAFYRQVTWIDQPDGRGRTWSADPLSWKATQPQAYGTHTQQIVTGWALGAAASALAGPGAAGTLFYGNRGVARLGQMRPNLAATAKAPPAGAARVALGAIGSAGVGVVGVRAISIARISGPSLKAVAQLVPVGNALATLPAPVADVEGIATSA